MTTAEIGCVSVCRWLLATLIAYLCFSAVVLLNGLIGIFAASFDYSENRPGAGSPPAAAWAWAWGGAGRGKGEAAGTEEEEGSRADGTEAGTGPSQRGGWLGPGEAM